MHGSNADMAVVIVILATRFIVPLFIPRFPLPAILVCLVVDAADQSILQNLTDLSLDNYQNYDKALDIYYLTVAYLAVYRNWTNGIAVEAARFLWYYRLVGVLAFEITQERWLLMLFPNTFEYFFIAYEVVRTCWDPRRMSRRAVIGLAAFIWIFIKLPQEWWIHVAQNDFTDFMKETIFGVDGTDSWADAFGNRPFVLVAILAAIGAIVFAGLHYRKRLRPVDWSFRVDVDRPIPELDIPEADPHVPSMQWPILEKLVLIGLISGIFTNVLEVGATGAQIVGATLLVVLANAGISHVMAARSIEWSSLAFEFVVLAVVNTALLTVFANLVGETDVNRAMAWFFGLLLTMIIVLFDRFRTDRLDRIQPPGAPVAAEV